MPFISRLQHWAMKEPERAAVVVDGRVLTYAALVHRAERVTLPGDGTMTAGDGTMTALDTADPLDFAVGMTAVVGRGRCAAVLDPRWSPEIRNGVLERLRPDAVLNTVESGLVPAALSDAPDESLFYCGFTSGTTGMPKAFLRSVGSWRRSLERSVPFFGVAPGTRVLAPGPLASSLTLYALAESLYAGATFHAVQAAAGPALGPAVRAVLERERIQHLVAVPAALRLALERAGEPFPDLGCVVSGGAKLAAADEAIIRKAAPGARIFEYYGASELSFVAARELGGTPTLAVGKPFPGVRIRVEPSAKGSGTVWVHTDTAAEGYAFGDDGAAFRRDGNWVTVGDHGWIDDDGALHLTGRQADMMVTSGTNVYPSEVENALASEGIPHSVVLGVPDPRRGQSVAAVLQPSPGRKVDVGGLRHRLAKRLSPQRVPHLYFRCETLPLSAGGKPDRAVLLRWIQDGDGRLEPLK